MAVWTRYKQQSTGLCKTYLSHLDPFSGKEKRGRFNHPARKANGNPLHITLVFKFSLHSAPRNHVSYQGIDVFHLHGPAVENIPAQHNEEEEKAQQHVAHVAEDIIEGTVGEKKV